ncbi:hypothetical protein D3C80_1627860 [compost metagenome]
MCFDTVGNLQQDARTLLDRRTSPGIGGGMGSVQGTLDIIGVRAWELCNRLAVDRRTIGEVLATERRNEITADVIAIT